MNWSLLNIVQNFNNLRYSVGIAMMFNGFPLIFFIRDTLRIGPASSVFTAAFFLLATEPSATDYAKLDGLHTFYKPAGTAEIEKQVLSFLTKHSVDMNDIDLVITGRTGNAGTDRIYDELTATIFKNKILLDYKNLCGEYPTAAAFAMWLGANIIKSGTVPAVLNCSDTAGKKIVRILIYNQHQGIHHSLSLLSAC